MPDLIPPHGGLTEPINRTVPADEIGDFVNEAAALKRVPVSDADLSTLYRIGDGGLSPLKGAMDRAATPILRSIWSAVLRVRSMQQRAETMRPW